MRDLLDRQWNGYARNHMSRANLWMHLFLVPLFLIANVTLLVALFQAQWGLAIVALAVMAISMALQGRGHKSETNAPEPFTDPANAILRILLEQWITFPRFVLTGGWLTALGNARK